MDGARVVPLDESKLTEVSRAWLERLLAWKPDWKSHCFMDLLESGCDLRVILPSPTGNPLLTVCVWFAENSNDETIGFGNGWVEHGQVCFYTSEFAWKALSIFECLQAIIEGDVAIFAHDSSFKKSFGVLQLSNEYEMAEELAHPDSNGRVFVKSWDGTIDREIIAPMNELIELD